MRFAYAPVSYGGYILLEPRAPVVFTDPANGNSLSGVVNLSGPYTVWQSCCMDTLPVTTKYKNHRFPVEVISHAVWLYFRFCLSFRDVEELLFERGVVVTYEAVRKWCRKFGQQYANQLRRRRPQPGGKGHLDEGAPRTHARLLECGAALEMRGGPSEPVYRSRLQTASSCSGQ